MSNYDYKAPDLASILAGLASLAPQPQPQPPQAPPPPQESGPSQVPVPYHQAQSTQPNHQYQQILQQQLEQASRSIQPGPPPVAAVPNPIDPATITEWSAGLRCVMKTVARHENVMNDIRRMIKVQHEHEEQWFKGREALLERQVARKEGQKKLDEVMKAIGGAVSSNTPTNTTEELARELETFDMKVYKAQMQMAKEMTSKLRNMGVPFFGTRTELIRPMSHANTGRGDASKESGGKALIDEIELVKLQRKMLGILEDLCSD
ncbi:hypothetical protein HYALB_00001761 [Hymenoscyphus albidus]|uniref:Uncharacterized protein n=1 Tax=Hymenoscyphus albidus TaxID=595503 RepID=A0A9N9LMI0_9HELO|nr:hypothetical protein HYALB_00001761 [Hymenoscyphus albidus]